MKHRHGNRILSRVASDRKQLLQNLSSALLLHGSIVTEKAKAKELRRFLEPLVTKAKGEMTLHRQRILRSQLINKSDFQRLVTVAETNKNRPGGYLRLTALPLRLSDGAQRVRVDILS